MERKLLLPTVTHRTLYTHKSIIDQPNCMIEEKDVKLNMLIIATKHDLATIQSSNIAFQLFEILKSHPHINLKMLFGWYAIAPNIIWELAHNMYDLIVYFGHGFKDAWWDGFMSHLFSVNISKLFRGSIVYTMSCHTAETFAKMVINNGAKAYIGNTEEVWGALNSNEHNYAVDFARPFQNEILNLLAGVSVKNCVAFAKQEWQNLIEMYISNVQKWQLANTYINRAMKNKNFHIYRGDGDATLLKVLTSKEEIDLSVTDNPNTFI